MGLSVVSPYGQRNKPRRPFSYPTSYYPEHVRQAIYKRRAWEAKRDRRLESLYSLAVQNRPGYVFRYLQTAWMHMHPYYEWPEFLREQNERLAWLHHKYDLSYQPWERVGPPINPRIIPYLDPKELEPLIMAPFLLISSIGSSSSGGGGGGGSPVAGAYAVDVANLSGVANDANDGIWDSDGPWATWGRLVTALEAGTFGIGDTVYMRAGTYVPTALVEATGGGTTVSSSKITLSGWPGETAMIDWSVNDDRTMLVAGGGADGGSGPFILDSANYRIRDLSFTSYEYGFALRANAACPGLEFINLTRTLVGTSGSTGNAETCINMNEGSNASGFLIEGCDLSDGNYISGNGSTVYVIHTTGTIRNNLIGAYFNSGGIGGGYVVHIKRMNNSSVLGNLTIENNVIGRVGSEGVGAIYYNNVQYGLIRNNCMSAVGENSRAINGSDTGEPSNWPWYRCQVLHNTTRRTSGAQSYGLCIIDNNNAAGNAGTENTVQDNAVDGSVGIMMNQTPKTHNNVFDYNLYHTDGTFQEFASNYSNLAAWQGATTYMSAPDLNSDEESIPWNTTLSQWDPQTYRLGASSAGIGSASDATDRGADVDNVGPVAIGY